MKTLFRTLSAALAILIVFAAVFVRNAADPAALTAEKYENWSGVLRIWTFDGWAWGAGGSQGWLNLCATSFEKRHAGVYVEITPVSESAMRDFAASGIRPPDAVVFPTGLLSSDEHLIPIDGEFSLREGLPRPPTAVPIALGLYAWAHTLPAIPVDWGEISAAYPPDAPHNAWSAALLSLCTGLYAREQAQIHEDLTHSDLDFGLPAAPTPSPLPTQPPRDGIPMRAGVNFHASEHIITDFLRNTISAAVVSQAEIARLEALSEAGKLAQWQVTRTGNIIFTDQIAYFGIVDTGDAARQNLCAEFLTHLLSERCQDLLAAKKVFSVCDRALYASGAMAHLEASVCGNALCCPDVFSDAWRADAPIAARDFLENVQTAEDSLKKFLHSINTI